MINSRIDELIITAENNRKDMDERLSTAQLCYNSAPNIENRLILDSIKTDTIKARYYLTLIKILKLLSARETDYYKAIDKRKELLDLSNYRRNCLEKIGVTFSIDPFSRIKIEDQIELINGFGINDRELADVKRSITLLSNRIDEMKKQNDSFLAEINHNKIMPIAESKKVTQPLPNIPHTESFNDKANEISDYSINVNPTKIIKISDASTNFMFERVKEKTTGVINRVNELIQDNSDDLELDITPEIVIEQSDNSDNLNKDEDIFIDEPQTDLFVNDYKEVNEVSPIPININNSESEEDIFSQVTTPFDEPTLFNDRADDDLFYDAPAITPKKEPALSTTPVEEPQTTVQENESDVEMPDLFWDMQDTQEENESQDNILSFEEGLAKLNLTEDNTTDVKTRKLVA